MNRFISEILWWWRTKHNPMSRNHSWKRAREAERLARRRGSTRAIHRAREDMRKAVHDDLRGAV